MLIQGCCRADRSCESGDLLVERVWPRLGAVTIKKARDNIRELLELHGIY